MTETNALNKVLNTTNRRVDSLEKDVNMYKQKFQMLLYMSLDIESRSWPRGYKTSVHSQTQNKAQ